MMNCPLTTAPNGWRLSCRTDNFQIVLNETSFMLITKLIITKVMKYKELNNENQNPPHAMRKVPTLIRSA